VTDPSTQGVHGPVQAPASGLHVGLNVHAAPLFCQVPPSPQAWGCWPLHCFCPGEQDPEHAPLTHVELVHVTELPQVPLAVQVSTPLPDGEHRVALGPQTP
jgi:hypothetical protein